MCFLFDIDNKYFVNFIFSTYFIFNNMNFFEPAFVAVVAVDVDDDDAVYVNGPIVVREKTHESAPMSVAEAVDRMELVGHDFYLFTDSESGLPSVVYRRQSFDYGLIRLSA